MRKHLNTIVGLTAKATKLAKVAKLLKLLLSVASMAIFGFVTSWQVGVALGGAVLVLLFLHELGHIIALKIKGHGIRLPFFIPMVGAVIMSPQIHDRDEEAYVGYGGPLLGTLAAMLFAVPYLWTYQPIWISGAYIGLLINAFNMIPLSPLDGGRITQACDRRLRWAGYLGLLAVSVAIAEPGVLIIWMLVVSDFHWPSARKLATCRALWALMALLTVLGVGVKSTENKLDCILGMVLLLLFHGLNWLSRRHHRELAREEMPGMSDQMCDHVLEEYERIKLATVETERPMPSGRVRLAWGGLWLGLGLIQFLAMHYLMHLMK